MKIISLLLSLCLSTPVFANGRLFTAASSNKAQGGASVTDYPFTIFACVRRASTGSAHAAVGIADASENNQYTRIGVSNNDDPFARTQNGATDASTSISTTIGSGTWHRITGVFASSTSRTIYWNGSSANDTTSAAQSGIDQTTIGAIGGLVAGQEFFNGDIAWVVIWNVALTAAEISALESGAHPMRVRQSSRATSHPLWAMHSPEINIGSQGVSLTLTGTAATAGGCPMPPWSGQ